MIIHNPHFWPRWQPTDVVPTPQGAVTVLDDPPGQIATGLLDGDGKPIVRPARRRIGFLPEMK